MKKVNTSTALYAFFFAVSALFVIVSLFVEPINTLLPGLWKICTFSEVLTVDSCQVGGLNGAMLNAGLLGFITILLLKLGKVQANGTSFGAFFLAVGYGFFGKNCINIWPFALGVWLYALSKKESYGKYAHFSIFSGALAPVVSEMIFNRHLAYPLWLGIILGIVMGALIGFIMPAVSAHAATLHKGHNLYNAGVSAGLIGVVLFGVYKNAVLKSAGADGDYGLNSVWTEGQYHLFFVIFLCALFAVCLIVGLIMDKGLRNYGSLIMRTGHGCDYTALDGFGAVLINFGFLGLMTMGYFLCTGAKLTGPVIGALLCLTCWAGNGSHPRNVLPIMVGYMLASLVNGMPLSTNGWLIGLCFASGLSPISGRWGYHWGIIAGFLHALVVLNAAAFHGGFNVYNGGFTSGLLLVVLIPVIEKFGKEIVPKAKKEKQDQSAAV